jgi:steroid delta-isomerase-like uncharacterized protein
MNRDSHSPSECAVLDLYDAWSRADHDAMRRLVAPLYTIHSDPGDAWEGQSLDREAYVERYGYSRLAFPDLTFVVHDVASRPGRVAVRWSATGTQSGPLRDLPATGKPLTFTGQTFYELRDGQVAGHWQVIDRLGFLEQLRPRTQAATGAQR